MYQEDGKINIEGYNASTIKQMLRFMYSDYVECQEYSTDLELLAMAKEFKVDDLQHAFEDSVKQSISMKNVVDIWMIGNNLENKLLKKVSAKFIKMNFEKFKKSEEFRRIIVNDKKDAVMLMIDAISVASDKKSDEKMNAMKNKVKDLMEASEE